MPSSTTPSSSPPPTGPEGSRRLGGGRDSRFDTAAGLLIILVVAGHAVEGIEGRAPEALYLAIYTFHMPAFVWISGYVTRFASSVSLATLAAKLLFPLAIFHVLGRLMPSVLEGSAFDLRLDMPAWTLWYLMALFFWRWASPWLRRVPGLVPVSLVAGVLVGAVPFIGLEFTADRIITFLPFFAAGLLWRDIPRGWKARPLAVGAAVAVLVAISAMSVALFDDVNRRWVYLSRSFDDLDQTLGEGVVTRLIVYAAVSIATCAVLVIALRPSRFLASIGQGSLTVYLLHALVLAPVHLVGAPEWLWGTRAVVASLLFAVVFAWLASRPIVATTLAPVLDARWWTDDARRWRRRPVADAQPSARERPPRR